MVLDFQGATISVFTVLFAPSVSKKKWNPTYLTIFGCLLNEWEKRCVVRWLQDPNHTTTTTTTTTTTAEQAGDILCNTNPWGIASVRSPTINQAFIKPPGPAPPRPAIRLRAVVLCALCVSREMFLGRWWLHSLAADITMDQKNWNALAHYHTKMAATFSTHSDGRIQHFH